LMCALELVSDRTTKKPIDKATPVKLQKAAYESGAMIRVSGPNVILSPPLVLTAEDVDTILAALRSGFQSL
jgi:adenosylmethionine-8-amino-7-oxononanoate aminotransferase